MKKSVFLVLIICGIIAAGVFVGAIIQNTNTSESTTNSPTTDTNTSTVTQSPKSYTPAEVAGHDTQDDCWIIIAGNVYDVGAYLKKHPGGEGSITPYCGKDATQAFDSKGGEGRHSETANSIKQEFLIGTVSN